MRKLKISALILIFTTMAAQSVFAAQSTTYTYGANKKGWYVRTQDAYLPDRNITGLGLSAPEDMAFGQNGELYIADTGNKRVVVYDTIGDKIMRTVEYDGFSTPRGVFVAPNETLYVADSAAGAIYRFSRTGEIEKEIYAPNSIAFGDTPFSPYRLAVDPRGSLYVIGEGVYNGIIQLSGEGEFLGYFASNKTTLSFTELLQQIFFTDRQKEGLADRLPLTFSNVFADYRGIIYSTSMGRDSAWSGVGIKKHDMAGRNTLSPVFTTTSLTGITVDKSGMIYTTSKEGYIQVNANDGQEIFFFGAGRASDEDIAGLYRDLYAVAVSDDGHIWTLDHEKAFLQSFTPTEYALSIYRALNLFNDGLYDSAGVEWTNVLRFNQMSVLAHNGLGKSYLYRQEYEKAANEFEVAGNRAYYSQAYWETRNKWLLNNLSIILVILVVLFAGSALVKRLDRKRVVKTAVANAKEKVMTGKYSKNIFFAFSVARHPLDSFYYMKRREKGSVKGAAVMFALFFAAYTVYQTSKAYILQYAEIEDMDFSVVFGGFFGIFALFVICNYLVTSINDGEGGIKDIFKIVSYASFPLTVTLFLVTALTYIVTLNETFLLSFLMIGGFCWSGAVLWLGLQEVHNYSFGATVKSVLITAVFMLIALVVIFNLTILCSQFVEFVDTVVREAIANVTKMY